MNRDATLTSFIATLICILSCALAGCDGSGSGAGADGQVIRFAYQNRIGSAACIVAVEEGFLEEASLDIKAFRFNSGPACAEALYSGSADIGAMGDTTAIIASSRGAPLTIIGSHGAGEHRHRLVAMPDSGLSGPEDLVGRRVAVKKGTSTYGGYLAWLKKNDVNPSAVDTMNMRPSEMPDALAAGSIEAFVASEPTPSLAEARGAAEAATMGGLGNEYPIFLLAKQSLLAERPDEVRRFLKAIQQAEEFIAQRPEETARLLARITGLKAEVSRRTMQRHRYALRLDEAIKDSLRDTADFLVSEGIIDAPPDLGQALDSSFLPADKSLQ